MVIAYLRVSTNKQILDNQQEEIQRFAETKGLQVCQWYKEVVSGKTSNNDRSLGTLLEKLKAGDILIVTELSRLSRTVVEITNILHTCLEKKVVLYSTKDGHAFEDNINSKVLCFAFALVAEIEHKLISLRTKEALHRLKGEGQLLGRPLGSSPQQQMLRDNIKDIQKRIDNGISRIQIAKEYNVSKGTLYRFLKEYNAKQAS